MAVRSGAQYLEGLRDGRAVWYGGERVRDVTTHPAFATGARAVAQLYDLQHAPAYKDILTFASPKTGELVGRSFLIPRYVDELIQRRAMLEIWAEASCGMLGQSPDYMNIGLMSLAAARDVFAQAEARFGIHILRYYEECREQDRCLARLVPDPWPHTGKPDRTSTAASPHLSVVAQRREGLVVRGACMLVTLAPFADDLVIYSGAPLQPGEEPQALVCAVPVASPGLSLLCRETVGRTGSRFDHPLATRFVDAIAIGGVLYPQSDAVHAALRLFPVLYPRMLEIPQLLGAGGYMLTPSERDLQSPVAEAIAKYYQGPSVPAARRIQLFRLAWDMVGESFGARQQLYERYFTGDPVSLMAARYLYYDKTTAVERVQALLEASRLS